MGTKSIQDYEALIQSAKKDAESRGSFLSMFANAAVKQTMESLLMLQGIGTAVRAYRLVGKNYVTQASQIESEISRYADNLEPKSVAQVQAIIDSFTRSITASTHQLNLNGNFANLCQALIHVAEKKPELNLEFLKLALSAPAQLGRVIN